MAFLDNLTRHLPAWLGGGNRPYGKQVLELRPLRHPSVSWELIGDDRYAVITIPRGTDGWTNYAARIFGIPATRKIELTDELATYVWTSCDGSRTVAQIAGELSARYKLNKRQSEVSVLTFLKTLQTKRLIGIPTEQALSYKDKPSVAGQAARPKNKAKETGQYAGKKRSGKSHSR